MINHKLMCVCVCVCVRACVCVCVCVCSVFMYERACVHECMRECVSVSVSPQRAYAMCVSIRSRRNGDWCQEATGAKTTKLSALCIKFKSILV